MSKAKTSVVKTFKKGGIQIPKGFEYLDGNVNTGKSLRIKDTTSGSVYVWVTAQLAIEKINLFLNEVARKISSASSQEEEKKYRAFYRFAASQKVELALLPGVFFKEGSKATFRIVQ